MDRSMLDEMTLLVQLLADIKFGHQPTVARTLLAYRPSEIRAVHGFMAWISRGFPLTWDTLVAEGHQRLPDRTEADLADLWKAYRQDGVGDGPVFQLGPK